MATFNSNKFIPTNLKDLSGVVQLTKQNFETKGYIVNVEDSSYGSFISLTKGGIFKTILGMKTSLNLDVKILSGGISVDAKVGIFGQQLIPSLIMWFVAWPVLLTQITGLVQQANLDDEAINVIETAVKQCENGAPVESGTAFCVNCGSAMPENAAFCSSCGTKQ